MAGLTPAGFERRVQEEILEELIEGLRSNVSQTIRTSTDTVTGQVIKLLAEELHSIWELAEDVYGSAYPNSAAGRSLRQISLLSGTVARDATYSRVAATVNVDAGTYPVGSLIAHKLDDPQARFVNLEEVTNPGPSPLDVTAIFQAEDPGPIELPIGQLTSIAAFVAGWNTVTNLAPGTPGLSDETNEELRLRREEELAASGSSTAPAIAADIRQNLAGILNVRVLKNDSDAVDVNGLPPHSVEAIVYGPVPPLPEDDLALAEQIDESKAAGIQAFGITGAVPVTDSEGNVTTIGFTRPVERPVEVLFTLGFDVDAYAGDAAVAEAIADYVNAGGPGEDLRFLKMVCAVAEVPGVLTIGGFGWNFVGDAPSSADLFVSIREVARTNASLIAVTSSVAI